MVIASNSSILIVLLGAIGDVTRAMPIVEAIKSQRPQSKITWLIEPKSVGMVRLARGVDEVLVFQRGKGVAAIKQIVGELRSRHFDITLDFQRHFKSGIFSKLSRAPIRIGFARKDSKEGNWLFNTHHIPTRGSEVPKIEQYLDFLTELGLDKPAELAFGVRELSFPKILVDLGERTAAGIVGFVLSSSRETKDWPVAGYRKLLQLLFARDGTVACLIGTQADQIAAEALIAENGFKDRLFNYCGKTSLEEAAAIIKACDVVVGPDSGPGHIASAVGTPYVGLFGPTDPVRTGPLGMEDFVVRAEVGCSPCGRKSCPGLNKICMRLISPEAVFRKVEAVLG